MKKFFAVLAVLALTVVSSVAFAEVTVSGSIDIRNLATNNTADMNSDTSDENRTTQERVRLAIDAKNEGVKGRIQIENDWDVWGRLEAPQGNGATAGSAGKGFMEVREAWIDFGMPFGLPGHIKVGHQFLQLGNAWFFRSNKYGSDAWLVGFPGKNTVAFVDVKISEGTAAAADDTDALVLLDIYKMDDKNTVGAYFARVRDPQGKFVNTMMGSVAPMGAEATLDTIGLHYNGMVGPVKLQAEFDMQMGSYEEPGFTSDFGGNQIVVQAQVPMDALTINATVAMGSGDDGTDNNIDEIITALDKDPHYTFVYEYFTKTASSVGTKNTGFANTTALSLGASYKVSKNVTVGLDYWMLSATETSAGQDDEVGSELDAKILWALNDNLSWNWTLGRFMPGKFYGANPDDVDAVQGVLSYKF